MNPAQRDPYAELEARRVNEWKSTLIAEPELLDGIAAPSETSSRIIRDWDEIPDVLAMSAPRIEWLVEGIIPKASVTLIAGEPGSYKSWLALCLLRGVACGGKFLERQCVPLDILYLDRENPLPVVRERMAIVGIDSLGCAKYWGGWLSDAAPVIGDARLLQIAREHRPLIIFDSLIRFHSSDENSATEMAQVMQNLRALANAGATVIVLHHRAKSETSRYRGSSDIAGGVDVAFSVSRDRQAEIVKLECFKTRFSQEFSMTLRPELSDSGDFAVTEAPQVTAGRAVAEKLAEMIRSKSGQTQSELLLASGLPKGKARAALEEFDGQLWRSERGAHNAKRFFPLENPTPVEIEV